MQPGQISVISLETDNVENGDFLSSFIESKNFTKVDLDELTTIINKKAITPVLDTTGLTIRKSRFTDEEYQRIVDFVKSRNELRLPIPIEILNAVDEHREYKRQCKTQRMKEQFAERNSIYGVIKSGFVDSNLSGSKTDRTVAITDSFAAKNGLSQSHVFKQGGDDMSISSLRRSNNDVANSQSQAVQQQSSQVQASRRPKMPLTEEEKAMNLLEEILEQDAKEYNTIYTKEDVSQILMKKAEEAGRKTKKINDVEMALSRVAQEEEQEDRKRRERK